MKLLQFITILVCPKVREEIGTCDRNPGSPNQGLLTKTVHSYDIEGCDCVPKILNKSEVCGELGQLVLVDLKGSQQVTGSFIPLRLQFALQIN